MSPSGVFTHALPERGAVAIGRGTDCDVQIDDLKASRRHCVIHLGDECEIEDLGSTNGTMLAERRLPANERVAFGRRARSRADPTCSPFSPCDRV